ncbi:MAG: hypothetical protein J7L95_01010 [Prolixibacteraceae bacterium]|nr:hypothetical protein [Prolixibacteraceae bacterium]
MKRIDAWYRQQLQMIIWEQWEKTRIRWHNFIKPGIGEYANTRKSGKYSLRIVAFCLATISKKIIKHSGFYGQTSGK